MIVKDILKKHGNNITLFESCSGKVFQMYNVDWSKFPSDVDIEFIEPSNEESQ
jgi:hypothetical protein